MNVTLPLAEVGRWALVVVVLALALIGFLYLTRGTLIRHVRGTSTDSTPIAPDEPTFPLGVAILTGAVLTTGNRVEVALNGEGTYERLWEDLRAATQSITLQLYYGKGGQLKSALRKILVDRAAAGVRVYLLHDAFGFSRMPREDRTALEAAGVRVIPFRPLRLLALHLAQNRSHVRGIVIDGRIGWTGGFGIDDKWLGDGRTNGSWRETNVRFEGPAVRQLQAAFVAAWAEATGVLLTPRVTLTSADGATVKAGLLHTYPTMGATTAERFLALSIAGAKTSIYITNAYFIPDDNFVGLLADASRRGVDVRILTGGARTDVRVVRFAGRARYEELLVAGVRIYEWLPTVLHSKTFVVDGLWATIGSKNFDNRSLALNDEATLMILDEAFGRQMEEIFFDDVRHAEEIRLPDFRRRGYFERVAEDACGGLARLL
jgi:cardiolipin synthase A/B